VSRALRQYIAKRTEEKALRKVLDELPDVLDRQLATEEFKQSMLGVYDRLGIGDALRAGQV
jgi:hypothetical protein